MGKYTVRPMGSYGFVKRIFHEIIKPQRRNCVPKTSSGTWDIFMKNNSATTQVDQNACVVNLLGTSFVAHCFLLGLFFLQWNVPSMNSTIFCHFSIKTNPHTLMTLNGAGLFTLHLVDWIKPYNLAKWNNISPT